MITTMYLYLRQLSERKNINRNGEINPRKQPRYDLCFTYGYWSALDKLKNNKGELFFNLIQSDRNKYRKRNNASPEYYLQCTPSKSKAINFSGLRFQHSDNGQTIFASGEPSLLIKLTGDVVNPMYEQRNDGFLFIFTENMDVLEILIIDNGRSLIDKCRTQLVMGYFKEELAKLRELNLPK